MLARPIEPKRRPPVVHHEHELLADIQGVDDLIVAEDEEGDR